MSEDVTSRSLSGRWSDAHVDSTIAHAARVYDYLLGGINHFPVDVDAARQMYASAGGLKKARKRVRAQRDFLGRIVRHLAAAGVGQFLDLGTGIPNADNVHEVAQQTAPDAKVVSVDHDPVVLAHAHQLRDSTPEGTTDFIFGDIRDHEAILGRAAATLDFARPIAVVMVGVLHHFRDDERPETLVRHYIDAIPSGSYVVLENIGREADELSKLAKVMATVDKADFTLVPRTRAELARFFEGVELIEPGIVYVDEWRPDGPLPDYETRHPCGVGRKT